MLNAKHLPLSGWGNVPVVSCPHYRPEKQREVEALYRAHKGSLIARGLGRSYGDAALNVQGVIGSERLCRFLAFDPETGIVRMQAGVTVADILSVMVPRGWILPVIPGTQHATIGGCVASDVHGKNHYSQGSLARHIVSLQLRLPDGEAVLCSREKERDIFFATAGGMGLTGFIEEVTLQLLPISSSSLRVDRLKVKNLEEMISAFRQAEMSSDYMVGWIDHFGKGDTLGRGVFEQAVHIAAPEGRPLAGYMPAVSRFTVPFMLPGFVLNKYSMALYNRFRFGRMEEVSLPEVQDFEGFFHPLDTIGRWNRLYGRKGFLQYQCMIPEGPQVEEHIHSLLEMIQQSGLFSFLAVLKYHGPHEGMLSFPLQGFSLALDFPHTRKVLALLTRLDEKLCAIGGRVYLAKDARLKPEMFARMYKDALPRWRRIAAELDPMRKIESEMEKRLRIRG